MTQERLEELQKLNNYISYTAHVLDELGCADGLCICGYSSPKGAANKYLIGILEEEDDYLRTLITKYYEDKLKRLRKEFEEA